MVYCKIKERHEDSAIYNIGTTVNDMSGEITFFKSGKDPVLNKQAEKRQVGERHIVKLYIKYADEFAKGIFKEKLAIEIG